MTFVPPSAPVIVSIRELTGNANTPVIIVQEPENSTVKNNGDGTLTITFLPPSNPERFSAPALVLVYQDASGELREAKQEFAVTQQGDVPSLIQTGGETNPNQSSIPVGALALLIAMILGIDLFRRTGRGREV